MTTQGNHDRDRLDSIKSILGVCFLESRKRSRFNKASTLEDFSERWSA